MKAQIPVRSAAHCLVHVILGYEVHMSQQSGEDCTFLTPDERRGFTLPKSAYSATIYPLVEVSEAQACAWRVEWPDCDPLIVADRGVARIYNKLGGEITPLGRPQ